MTETVLLDSITDVDDTARGALVVSGSHGGLYPAMLASRAGVRSVLFNDAGIGFNRAGVAGIEALTLVGMAGAAVDCQSARIGSAKDMMRFGIISFANRPAADLGVLVGMSVTDAGMVLCDASQPTGVLPGMDEARSEVRLDGADLDVLLVDSASLVTEADAGRVIIAGSHGALIGGDPRRALKAKARFACFNDAGVGREKVGISRLPALEHQGIAAVTVSHETAVIGDARSSLKTGVISAVNEQARALGVAVDDRLHNALIRIASGS